MGEPTRGPWAVNDLPGVGRVAVESEHEHGYNDVNDGWIICLCEGPDALVNAHLIAAAPDLFEALRDVAVFYGDDAAAREVLRSDFTGPEELLMDDDALRESVWNNARAALLKATPGGTTDAG